MYKKFSTLSGTFVSLFICLPRLLTCSSVSLPTVLNSLLGFIKFRECLNIFDVIIDVLISFIPIGSFLIFAGTTSSRFLDPVHVSRSRFTSFVSFSLTAWCHESVSISLTVSFLWLIDILLFLYLNSVRFPIYSFEII